MEKLTYPANWSSAILEELLIYVLGGDWGKDNTFNDPNYIDVLCIRASELRNWDKERGETAALRKVKKSSLERRELREGDIILEISGGGPDQPVGRTALIDRAVLSKKTEYKKICTNFFRLIRPSIEINSTYLNLYLQSFYKSGKISEYQAGSNNLRNLKFNDYTQIEVPIAPLNEQKRIVAKIEELFSELDNGIAALKTAREQLKVYRQAILKHAFEGKLTAKWREENADKLEAAEQIIIRIQKERNAHYQQQLEAWKAAVKEWEAKDKKGTKPSKPRKYIPKKLEFHLNNNLFKIPSSWKWVNFSDLIFSIRGGTTIPPIDTVTSLPILRSSSIRSGELILKEIRFLSEDSNICRDDFVCSSDLLFSRLNGTLEFVGVCAVVPKHFPKNLLYPDRLYRAKLVISEMAKFCEYYFSSPLIRKNIEKKAKSTAGHKRISIPDITEQLIPLMDTTEMLVLSDLLSAQFSIINKIKTDLDKSLLEAETLRQSILKKAFSGKLVTQDPNDEPANKLLTRIKAEKEQQKKSVKKLPTKQDLIEVSNEAYN